MLNCYDIANYFLAQVDEDAGDLISNPKLQKLVYYAQGINLALYNQPLFPEPLEAWIHGPVIPVLFYTYKRHEAGAIPPPEDLDFSIYNPQTRELLDEVYVVFGQYSAWKLYKMTHEELPWKNTSIGSEISLELMSDYFKTQVVT
jgi:uncharacterized phage-associated protein